MNAIKDFYTVPFIRFSDKFKAISGSFYAQGSNFR